MKLYIIANGKSIVSQTKVSKRTQKFIDCQWTRNPQNAQTYGLGDATDIAKQFGGKVLPYSEINKF
jgi:hypothetical protein